MQPNLQPLVERIVRETPVTDIHTHLFPASFGALMLWGIDDLLTYHYLVGEAFRYLDIPYDDFWAMPKSEQADLVWRTLFIEHSPISESTRGVLTILQALGLDLGTRELASYRRAIADMGAEAYVDKVFELAGVRELVMTNDPLDAAERELWKGGVSIDPRFKAALRLDELLNNWPTAVGVLGDLGFDVEVGLSGKTLSEVRRVLTKWVKRVDALYLAASLPPTFCLPEKSPRGRLIEECVLPVCRELGKPLALMIGVNRDVNPGLCLAGCDMGVGDINTVRYLCSTYPDIKFMLTMLARENQHELIALARSFRNLLPFGCWWFMNIPSLIEELTRMRFELLGLSVIPQHSDCRIIDQLIYKWNHSRGIIARVLYEKYRDAQATGWQVNEEEIKRDVADLFGGVFWKFLGK